MSSPKSLAAGRWHEYSLAFQLANVGAEVGRAEKRRANNDNAACEQAIERALTLLDLTIADPRWVQARRLKELTRLREVIKDDFYGDNSYHTKEGQWEKYFYPFNLTARAGRF